MKTVVESAATISRQSVDLRKTTGSSKALATAAQATVFATKAAKAAGIVGSKAVKPRKPYSWLYVVLFGRSRHRMNDSHATAPCKCCGAHAVGRVFRLIMTIVIVVNVFSFIFGAAIHIELPGCFF